MFGSLVWCVSCFIGILFVWMQMFVHLQWWWAMFHSVLATGQD